MRQPRRRRNRLAEVLMAVAIGSAVMLTLLMGIYNLFNPHLTPAEVFLEYWKPVAGIATIGIMAIALDTLGRGE